MIKKLLYIIVALLLFAGICHAATYYLRADGTAANKGAASGPCGTQANTMSISIHNGETFSANDIIKVCDDGGVFESTLIPPSSGTSGNPITYEAASGDSPVISTGNAIGVGDGETGFGLYSGATNIYSYDTEAADATWMNPYGAVNASGTLMHRYWQGDKGSTTYDAPVTPSHSPDGAALEAAMTLDGFSWSPSNEGIIFIRSESGNPATAADVVVGKRHQAVYISNKDYLTFDGIEFSGPNGGTDSALWAEINGADYGLIRPTSGTTGLVIQNCTFKNSTRCGIRFSGTNTSCSIIDNTFDRTWCGVNAYSVNSTYLTVHGNKMTNIGAQKGTMGDRGPISGWGNLWLVEENTIDTTGFENQAITEANVANFVMDYAIHICCGEENGSVPNSNNVIRYNYIKDAGAGGIFIDPGDDNEIYYNIIEGWNWTPQDQTANKSHGIQTKTWSTSPHPVNDGNKIYGNVVYGGSAGYIEGGGIRIVGSHTNLEIKNNIVFGNAESGGGGGDGTTPIDLDIWPASGNEVENNIFHTTGGYAGRWSTTTFDMAHMLGGTTSYWEYYVNDISGFTVQNNRIGNPYFTDAPAGDFTLLSNSDAINNGLTIAGYDNALDPALTDFSTTPPTLAYLDQDSYDSWEIGAYVYSGGGPLDPTGAATLNGITATGVTIE